MDSVLTLHAMEQSVAAPNKQMRIKTPKKNNRRGNFNSNTSGSENFAGLLNPPLLPPPSRTMSLSSSFSKPLLSVSPSVFNHQNGQNQSQNQNQPPLLPLPHASAIYHNHQPLLSRSQSSSNIQGGRRNNGTKNTSLTAKKSKPTKREEANKRSSAAQSLISASENRWGPDPKDLPKHLPVVLTSKEEPVDMFLGSSGFNLISPPPSSLPLPKFSLRSKLSCNAEASAAGSVVDDDGATNNLRRLLRLM
ncbi:uncharacterized protein LOC130727832 [Lotus japonicus]|uniref:uncharacterized protein LOC130727832 n=1 Tax=Lotus japonicus TaxID=34305 RepID=UPI00258358FA|nr:uncharacterized protein LOC130727832 [Lotus japonicus]